MKEYRQNAINYVKENVECVGYRDYIVEQLEVPAIPLERIKQLREEIDLEIKNAEPKTDDEESLLLAVRVLAGKRIDNTIKEYSE